MVVAFAGQRFGGTAPEEAFGTLAGYIGEHLERAGVERLYVSSGIGTDLAAMEAARLLDIPYVVVEPFHDHTALWPLHWAQVYRRLAKEALEVITLQGEYSPGVFDRRLEVVAQSVYPDGEVWTFWDGYGDRGVARILLYAPAVKNLYWWWGSNA